MTETDMLIIGGGIAGASTAYHLAQHGHDVTLLERGEIASEASGVNAGSIGAMGWGNAPDLEAYLTMGSLDIFQSLQLDLGYDIAFRQSGCLQAIHTEAQYAYTRDRVQHLRAHGYNVALLNSREARNIEPELNPALLGCMYHTVAGAGRSQTSHTGARRRRGAERCPHPHAICRDNCAATA